MQIESVEIYSDQPNAAIMRHPGRRFPGVLMQGDTLYGLCRNADEVCRDIGTASPGYETANEMRNALWAYLNHYKRTLIQHDMELPFCEDVA